jgi:dTDP-4-dehydrorhamnose reductase
MRVVIVGAKGQLGREAMEVFGADHEVRGLDLPECDASDPVAFGAQMRASPPDLLVNCAAYTRVDAAETDRDEAFRLNAALPAVLADAAHEHGARLIHVSTDYVFPGDRPPPDPYREEDAPGPATWYGQTKLEGERAVLERAPGAVVARTAWLYGRHGANFPRTLLRLALQDPARPLRVVSDQHGSPTWARRLAEQLLALAEAGAAGVYHAAGEGHATWYDFARLFLSAAGVAHEVVPCETRDYPTPAPRPRNSILLNARLHRERLGVFRTWEEDVRHFAETCGPAWIGAIRRET